MGVPSFRETANSSSQFRQIVAGGSPQPYTLLGLRDLGLRPRESRVLGYTLVC